MSTVIDTLVLELGIDPAKFTKGQKDAVDALRQLEERLEQGGKHVDAQGKKIGNFMSSLKREALGLTAAFFGGRGAKEFVQYVTTLDASVGRLAVTTKMSTQELSAWHGVAVQTGGTIEGMNGTLQGLNDQVNKFLLTGEGSFLPLFNSLGISLYDSNKQLKTSGTLLLDINQAVQGMDPARARALMQGIGIDPATINTLLMGNKQLRDMLTNQKNLAEITKEDAEAAQQLATAWHEAERAAEQMGRSITTWLSPALVTFLNRWRDIFAEFSKGYIISPDSLIGRALGLAPIPKEQKPTGAKPSPIASVGNSLQRAAVEGYIREAAIKRGIDPDVAVAVAKSEGLKDYVGDRGSSFGPFQLHYGNVASGGMAVGGLGDEFTKKTGLNARDPSTVRQQIDFSLDEAKKSGWGAWHGWRGLPRAGLDWSPGAGGAGGGVTNNNNSITVGTVEIHPASGDGETVARDFKAALGRQNFSASANNGLQ